MSSLQLKNIRTDDYALLHMINKVNVYIIHVKTQEERKKHMLRQMNLHACLSGYRFMTDGDMDTISHEEHQRLFSGELSVMSPAVSCAYKHISCYRDMLLQDIPFALIFEDDIFLESFFCDELQFILREIEEKKYKNFIVSLEDSSLTYVKGSEKKPDTRLYPATKGRMAGAYFLDRGACQKLVETIEQKTCHLPIDWFHNHCADNGLLQMFWAHPTLATQGSLNGALGSLIDQKKTGNIRQLIFAMSRWYKKLLYRLR